MRVFARVIEQGSFAGAAREMKLSPAVVTRLVADLEEHLRARLINRTTRRLSLTETGELYLERVHHILTEIEDAEALASSATTLPRGHLRVLCSPAFAVHQLAKHLPQFRAQYPRVTLDLSVTGPVGTMDENFDVSIVTEGRHPLDGSFIARCLACTEVITCAAPAYLDQRGRPKHPTELLQHDAMVPAFLREMVFHGGPWSEAERGAEAVAVTPPQPGLSTSHIDTLYAAALAGMGIAALPSYVVEDALMENALERVLPEWRLIRFKLHACMPTRKYLPARTRAFVDFLVQTFGGSEDDPWLLAAGCATRRPDADPAPAPDVPA
ncbi:MAG: LysR family transcriptional regulator [Burkholderiaceae bacterium]